LNRNIRTPMTPWRWLFQASEPALEPSAISAVSVLLSTVAFGPSRPIPTPLSSTGTRLSSSIQGLSAEVCDRRHIRIMELAQDYTPKYRNSSAGRTILFVASVHCNRRRSHQSTRGCEHGHLDDPIIPWPPRQLSAPWLNDHHFRHRPRISSKTQSIIAHCRLI
jgi:hypothetical protein